MHGTDRLLVADDSELAAAATRRFRPGGSVADGVALACAARAREPLTRVFVVAGVDELAGAITLALAARAVRARLGNLVVLCDDDAEDLALHLGVSGWHVDRRVYRIPSRRLACCGPHAVRRSSVAGRQTSSLVAPSACGSSRRDARSGYAVHPPRAGARDAARLVAALRRAVGQDRPSFVTVAGITPVEVAGALRAVSVAVPA